MYSLFYELINTPYQTETAISLGEHTVSYRELKALAQKACDNLSYLGLKKGDVITIALPNIVEAVISFYAVNALGGIANMVHPTLGNLKIKEIQEETHSKLLIGLKTHKSINKKITCLSSIADKTSWEKFISLSSPTYEYNHEDGVAVYLHSGGTTDNPKTIILSSQNFNAVAKGLKDMFYEGETVGYKSLTTLPLFHGFGLGAGVHGLLLLGMELVLVPKFDKEKTPDLIVDKGINMILGVPLIFQAILASKKVRNCEDLSCIKNCFVGGDNTPLALLSSFNAFLEQKHSSAKLCEGYGLTECVSVCAVNRNTEYKEGSIGLPLSTTEIAILGENGEFLIDESIGEICVSGDTVMQRYLANNSPCFMEKEGQRWLKTGDYGYRDEDGFYYFVERKKRIVKISGVTVFPSEVEMILRTHYAVSDVFVKPISENNQKLKAYVVKSHDVQENELKEYCRTHLMKWAVPEQIVFIDALPLTPIGKIDKKHEIFS